MGIVNIHKVTSSMTSLMNIYNTHDVTMNIEQSIMRSFHEYSTYTPWLHFMHFMNIQIIIRIFIKWRQFYFEYSCVTSWRVLIIHKWRHRYCEYSWSERHGIVNIHEMTWIFLEYLWSDMDGFWIFIKLRHGWYLQYS